MILTITLVWVKRTFVVFTAPDIIVMWGEGVRVLGVVAAHRRMMQTAVCRVSKWGVRAVRGALLQHVVSFVTQCGGGVRIVRAWLHNMSS
jgi:hypothetical protein